MYQALGTMTLRSGEQVELGVVRAPDLEWRDRILPLLAHKGVYWRWQNVEFLTVDVGIDASFFICHRDGQPFANVMTALYAGVGILGHVYTYPEDRGAGAASLLVGAAIDDFKARGGQALFLETGYGSTAYRIYERYGFHSLEPMSASMEFYTASKGEFEQTYFAQGAASFQMLDWRHYPASQALFAGDFPGHVRCAALQLVGRLSNDEYIIPLLAEELSAETEHRARVLMSDSSGAVVGFGLWSRHPFWPDSGLIDLYA